MKDDVLKEVKEHRWQKLTDILRDQLQKKNEKLVGETLRVLIDSEKKGKYYGRTDNYKVVEIIADKDSPCTRTVLEKQKVDSEGVRRGQFVDVKIVDSSAWMLKGIIPEN